MPTVTVLVPTRPGQADVPAVNAARKFDYPPELLEIIIARGRQPSVQRNAGLREARGELIYFLDDDSVAAPGNLRRAIERQQFAVLYQAITRLASNQLAGFEALLRWEHPTKGRLGG